MHPFRKAMGGITVLSTAALLLAACGGGTPGKTTTTAKASTGTTPATTAAPTGSTPSTTATTAPASKKQGGTVTFAEVGGGKPDFIFPITTTKENSLYNGSQFINLLYPSLVFFGQDGKSKVNPTKSLYKSIKYSNNNSVATITLKDWNWSDGKPISARDVEFFYNIVKANKDAWSQYAGQGADLFPDNIKSVKIVNPKTIQFTLDKSWNPNFLLTAEWNLITPIPQHVWDVTKAGQAVGNYDKTTAGAKAVFAYLQKEGGQTSTFTTNPLWQVVDGPWKLQGYQSTGEATFVPNTKYSGSVKPTISKFVEKPFTTNTAEFNVLRAGGIDVGYIPPTQTKQIPAIKALGYNVVPSYSVNVDYMIPNLTNPTSGPIFSQLYVRQAMEMLIPQKQIIQKVYSGYGVPGNGPVPIKPPSKYTSSLEKGAGPYPYSTSKAVALLKSHGWKVTPGGTDTCASPGTGANQCGQGIKAGAKMDFQLLYSSGEPALKVQSEVVKSSMAQAGITINLKDQPFNTVIGIVNPCVPKSNKSYKASYCSWDLGEYGGISYGTPFPTGNNLFTTGGALNAGSYSSKKVDSLVNATEHGASNIQTFYNYENTVAKQLPWLWVPIPAGIQAYKKTLGGVAPYNPFGVTTPENIYYKK
ncbi:MAG: peptide ABC transporter substrate-binding protein [Acidimicrobiales bacterium]